MSHVFFASATGFQQIELASTLVIRQNVFARSRALSRILAYQHLDYIFCSCTACSLTQGCTVLFFDAGFATLRRLREQLRQPGNHLRLKISNALRRLARRLARSSLSKNFGTRFITSNRSFRGRQRFSGSVSLRATAYAVVTHSLFQSSSKISS